MSKVVILCGGYGTRIRDVADDLPKPLIPVGNFPILWHIMKYYASYGHKEFVLCLGYKAHLIKEFFLNYQTRTSSLSLSLGDPSSLRYPHNHDESDWLVHLVDTGLDAMTGARLRRIKDYIGNDQNFFLTYGDGVGDINLNALAEFHEGHGRILSVTAVHPPGRFGELELTQTGQVKSFNEKPQVSEGRISGGFFLADRRIFDYLDDREDLVFEQEPVRQLVVANELMAYRHDGFWLPMDTYRDYRLLNDLYAKNQAPWINWKV